MSIKKVFVAIELHCGSSLSFMLFSNIAHWQVANKCEITLYTSVKLGKTELLICEF